MQAAPREILKTVYGYAAFRGPQARIVASSSRRSQMVQRAGAFSRMKARTFSSVSGQQRRPRRSWWTK